LNFGLWTLGFGRRDPVATASGSDFVSAQEINPFCESRASGVEEAFDFVALELLR
jgi:hypothetical protein